MSEKSITAFFNLDEICLNEYGNAKAYENPETLTLLENNLKTQICSMYSKECVDACEIYETPSGKTFCKATIHHLDKNLKPTLSSII